MSGRHQNHPTDGGVGFDISSLIPLFMMQSSRSNAAAGSSGSQDNTTLYIQMLLAMLIPLLIRVIQPRLQGAVNGFKLTRNRAHRTIVHAKEVGVWR